MAPQRIVQGPNVLKLSVVSILKLEFLAALSFYRQTILLYQSTIGVGLGLWLHRTLRPEL